MKSNFYIHFIYLMILSGCVGGGEGDPLLSQNLESDALTGCAEEGEALEASTLTFPGISELEKVSPTQVKIKWSRLDGVSLYHLFQISSENEEKTFLAAIGGSETEFLVSNLESETNYKFLLKAQDSQGKLDSNTHVVEVTTDAYEEWINQRSLAFSGTEYVSIGKSKELFGDGPFTVSFWFKTNSTPATLNGTYAFSAFYNYNETFSMGVGFSKTAIFGRLRKETNELVTISKKMSFSDGQWHHVALTYDKINFSFFVDGNLVGQKEIQALGFGTQPVLLGSLRSSKGFYRGQLDEFSIWNKAMSEMEIKELMEEGQSIDLNRHSSFSSLQNWVRFESGDGKDSIVDWASEETEINSLNLTEDSFLTDAP